MANTDVQITLEQAVAEVLTLLTGVDLTFNPAEDTFHVVARCLNRAMRSVALEHEWSYYSATENVGTAQVGVQDVEISSRLRPRIIGDDAVRLQTSEGKVVRWAYILPSNIRGQLRRQDGDQSDVRTTSSGLSDLVSTDEQLQIILRADWDLTRLVFNKDSITAARQIERIVNQREDILTTVNKLYFARRQLQVDLELEPPTSVERAVKSQLRIDALTADLDALTGGWFSKQLPATP